MTTLRNVTVAAQVDAGKSTLVSNLLKQAGRLAAHKAGDVLPTDSLKLEQERGITVSSMGCSMGHVHQGTPYQINLVDSPGHQSFNAMVSAALRITDGCVVLIDSLDGVMVQTETVALQAIEAKNQIVLLINKCDRPISELDHSPEDIYDLFVRDIADVNRMLSRFEGSRAVCPVIGTVAFGSAYHQWGFRLADMARIYAPKLNKTVSETIELLWKKKNFCKMIIEPIKKIYKLCKAGDIAELTGMFDKIGVDVPKIFDGASTKDLIRLFMGTWIPVAPAILDMFVEQLPSPVEAQTYRAEYLYTGPKEDPGYAGIFKCDPEGPTIIYISQMIPDASSTRFYAFGRVLSGRVNRGDKLCILEADHDPTTATKIRTATVQQVTTVMAGRMETCDTIEAGGICGLLGFEKDIIKTATLVSDQNLWPIKDMKFMVSPVVSVAIAPKSGRDLPKFKTGIQRLRKADPLLEVKYNEETTETILSGTDELFIEVALTRLRDEFCPNVEIVVNDPIVTYRETITTPTPEPCLGKSANKHNRLYCEARPIGGEFASAIEDGVYTTMTKDPKQQAREIEDRFGGINRDWYNSKRLWSLHAETGTVLIDGTTGVQYMNESSGNIVPGYNTAVAKGPLCGEPIRAVEFAFQDAKLHADSVHRGGDQLGPAARRVIHACMMRAGVRIQEPVFRVTVSITPEHAGPVYSVITQRRGRIIGQDQQVGSPMMTIEAHLPVGESFGFDAEMKTKTSGHAFLSTTFSHWQTIDEDPYDASTIAHKIVTGIRKRNKLPEEFPDPASFVERL